MEWLHRVPVVPGLNVLVHSPAGDFLMGRPERCSVAKKLFWTGGVLEPAEDRAALGLFARLAERSEVALDIGSNSGLFSMLAAKANPTLHIVAFDILPEACRVLEANLALNGLQQRVDVRQAGVGRGGTAFLAPDREISSEMPTALSVEATDRAWRTRVSILSLDEICMPRFAGKRLCVKIDVEGTEVDIFANGHETFRGIGPDIICEVLPSARAVADYDSILAFHGYRKFLITDTGIQLRAQIVPHRRFKDWFFTKRSGDFE